MAEHVNDTPRSYSKPFLLAVCRPPGLIAEDEVAVIKEWGNMSDTELHQVSLLNPSEPNPATELELTKYSGVIITGSPFGYAHPQETKSAQHLLVEERVSALARRVVAEVFPTLGICFGLQTLARATGGMLVGGFAEDLQAPEIRLTDAGKADPLTGKLPAIFRSYTGHSDAVGQLPATATLLASGSFCHVQMVRWGKNVYGTQFHPEITTAGMHIRINSYGDTYYPAAQKSQVIARCNAADVKGANQVITEFANRFRCQLPA